MSVFGKIIKNKTKEGTIPLLIKPIPSIGGIPSPRTHVPRLINFLAVLVLYIHAHFAFYHVPQAKQQFSKKSDERREAQPWFAPQVAHRTLVVDRVELIVETQQKPTLKLIPDPHRYKRDLRRQTLTRFTVLESLFTDTRSFQNPCTNAHVPSKRLLPASWLPPDQGKKVFPRTAEFSVVADPLRYEMQPSPTVLCRKWGMRGMRKRIASPPTIRLQSESGYTAFGHSDSIQANKSQVIIMRMRTPGISAPPQYSCISHCSSWLRV